ncbi:hypothetical protein JOF56_000898 [Kibdelosporangium banguiense]|uniref:Uncharacterized protein n=1 Tax=Kibdelosporangium banguiense TaxID=1365924 RepID=A0ABS4T9I2_9PSEU|nr:hypothetical protein [Kibdelosporangium banguiense]
MKYSRFRRVAESTVRTDTAIISIDLWVMCRIASGEAMGALFDQQDS